MTNDSGYQKYFTTNNSSYFNNKSNRRHQKAWIEQVEETSKMPNLELPKPSTNVHQVPVSYHLPGAQINANKYPRCKLYSKNVLQNHFPTRKVSRISKQCGQYDQSDNINESFNVENEFCDQKEWNEHSEILEGIPKGENSYKNTKNGFLDSEVEANEMYAKPKYTGYKPENGICFIPFKSLFTKPKQNVNSSHVMTSQHADEQTIDYLTTQASSLSLDELCTYKSEGSPKTLLRSNSEGIPQSNLLGLGHSTSRLSQKERLIVNETRKELKQRFESSNQTNNSNSKKVRVNIFVRPQESDTESPPLERKSDQKPVVQRRPVPPMIRQSSVPRLNRPIAKHNCNQSQFPTNVRRNSVSARKNSSKSFSNKRLKEHNIETLVSSTPNLLMNTFEDELLIDPLELSSEIKDDTSTVIPKCDFLKSVLADMNEMQQEQQLIREVKNVRSRPQNTPDVKGNKNTEKTRGGIYRKQNVAQTTSANPFPGNHSTSVPELMTNHTNHSFRKKLEEAYELHRRLQFCGIFVTKETVSRALMSPAQFKFYAETQKSG